MDKIDPRLTNIIDCLYRVTNKAIIVHESKLLLVQEKEGWYGLPGGGLDYGETIQAAIERELDEEVGIKPEDVEIPILPIYLSNEGIVDKIPRFTIYYRIRLIKSNLKTKELP